MKRLLTLIFGDPNKKLLKSFQAEADKINILESDFEKLSDDELRAKTDEFKSRLENGESLDDIAYEAFAVVREAAKRTLGQRHYDVQLIGGLALHQGKIAEMRTGEGKTLTSTLPVYLNALSGKGVHVVTVNDYLAKRDAVWMGQVFHVLGLTVGIIQHEGGYLYDTDAEESLRQIERKEAYAADITYGTNNQFGFDYLRDNMATDIERCVQRDLNFAIVDEIDSILIDEARTPLIISAPAEGAAELYYKFAGLVKSLKEDEDYNVDEKMRVATFTDEGVHKIEKKLGIDNLYANQGFEMIHHAEQALKAHAIFKLDKDYVVQDGEVKIVDEFTGRIMEGRRYSEGLHQAIEAKEGVDIKNESRTLATITFQNFFKMYDKLSGMTGTAETEAEEFAKIYGLEVVVIPTNKPIAREDAADKIFKSEVGKFKALVQEVKRRQELGQPVLIGTSSIEKNELMDELLTKAGIRHEMLNAKNHEREAQIIAQAGKPGAVTVATNMAGRGVDIKLGGSEATDEEAIKIKELGGLCVFGTERHESRRIDNQLRGRSGRQGDPGFTQFYVSMEDDLMRIFGGERMKSLMNTLGVDEDQAIESKMISGNIEKSQQRVEGHHFDARKRVLDFDEVLNKHRTALYDRRRKMLTADDYDPKAELREMTEHEVERIILFHTGEIAEIDITGDLKEEKVKGDWDPKEITEALQTIVPLPKESIDLVHDEFAQISKNKEILAKQRTTVISDFMKLVDERLAKYKEVLSDESRLQTVMRSIILRNIDNAWVRHLETMRYLRRGIGLRGYGQRDPLVEYNREAFGVFNGMNQDIEHKTVYSAFKILDQAVEAQKAIELAPSILERANVVLSGAAKTMQKKSDDSRTAQKARRAAARLIASRQSGKQGPSAAARAKARKKRKRK